MPFPLPALIRLMPTAKPLAQAWTFYATAQAADIIVDANAGWSLPSIVIWATAHMLLAVTTSGLLGAAARGVTGAQTLPGLRRLQLGLMALTIGLLLGLVILQQPTILLPAIGLALAYWWSSTPAPQELRT